MKYFRETENPTAKLPAGFMQGFLEVGICITAMRFSMTDRHLHRAAIEMSALRSRYILFCIPIYTMQMRSLEAHLAQTIIMISMAPFVSVSSKSFFSVEIISGNREFVNHDIAQTHKVIEPFL